MSNRTWACIGCGKTYRRDQMIDDPVKCGLCGVECEYVHWKIRVPSPKKKKEWVRFWELYQQEKAQLDKCFTDGNIETVELDIMNMRIYPKVKPKPKTEPKTEPKTKP